MVGITERPIPTQDPSTDLFPSSTTGFGPYRVRLRSRPQPSSWTPEKGDTHEGPSLHQLTEMVVHLPKGLAALRAFIRSPDEFRPD